MKKLIIMMVAVSISLILLKIFGLDIGDVNIRSFSSCKCQLYYEMTDEGCNDHKYGASEYSPKERSEWERKAANWCMNNTIIYYTDSNGNRKLFK